MKKFFLPFLSLIVIAGCKTTPDKDYTKLEGFAQGTTYSITFFDDSLSRDLSLGITDIIEQVDSSMSLYRENSIINRFNNSEEGIEIDSLLAEVVRLSLDYSRQTNGAFDITVGPLIKTWGFYGKKGEVPSDDKIKSYMKYIGHDKIWLENNFLHKEYPGVAIDVNAIAQGYVVDLLSEYLESKGVKDYLVELGGEIRTKGVSSRGDNWLVGIDRPDDHALSGENLQVILELSGESLVTSGNYRKFYERDGVRYSHTINPKTGYPVTHTLLSATVVDKTSAGADALATAFMVMGENLSQEWLKNNPQVEAFLISSNDKGEYKVWMSEKLKERVAD